MNHRKRNRVDKPKPDAHLEALVAQARQITEAWAARKDLWDDSSLKDPVSHYKEEPAEGGPILLLCSEGATMACLLWDDAQGDELRSELAGIGVYLALDGSTTAGYHLIDHKSELQGEFDRYAKWKWACSLIEADSEDVSGDLYQHFARYPQDIQRLHHRDFEKLVSGIFAARGWRTELGPGSGDKGVDLRIWQSDPLGDLLTLVQIKRYASHRAITLDAVAALRTHVDDEYANRGLFVTSSRYLPGVKEFASRHRHRLQLAETVDIQQWCSDSALAVQTARNRVLAMESFLPLVEEIRRTGSHPRLVVGSDPTFCIILRETKTAALLVRIPSLIVLGDVVRGTVVPMLTGEIVQTDEPNPGPVVFRATRMIQDNGRVVYWGQRELFATWNGQPHAFDFFS
jgi:hypothetical protein